MENEFLFIDDSEECLEVLSLFVESEFDNPIDKAFSGNQGIKKINEKMPSLIISDLNMDNGTGEDVYKFILESNIASPFILLCGESKSDVLSKSIFKNVAPDRFKVITKPFKKEMIVNTINQFLGGSDILQFHPEGYKKVSYSNLVEYGEAIEVFIKLRNKKLIKLVNRDEKDIKANLEGYFSKGAKHFYVSTEDYERLLNTRADIIMQKLKDNVTYSIQGKAIETLQERVASLGLDPKSRVIADKLIESTLNKFRKHKKLKKHLLELERGPNFVKDLAQVNSYVSVAMALETNWNKEAILEKLILCSYLFDISLSEYPHLAKILGAHEVSTLGQEDKKRVVDHPKESLDLGRDLLGVSTDAYNLVLCHHMYPNFGFPYYDAKILGPLGLLLNTAHFFSQTFLRNEDMEGVHALHLMKSKFNDGEFEKPFLILQKAL